MNSHSPSHTHSRFALAYANLLVRRPWRVLAALLLLGVGALYCSSQLGVDSNQLNLLDQEMKEVKEVKRVIDMVGGAGFLLFGLRSSDDAQMKRVADEVAEIMRADTEAVRSVTYKMPVEFIQKNMVLFIRTEDLIEAKKRINAYLRDQIRRNNPFYIEIRKTEPVKLELKDLIDRYSHVGQKSILDDYYLSDDRKMLMMLVKPMWDSTDIGQTRAFLNKLRGQLEAYSKNNKHGVQLVEDYSRMGDSKTIAYGFTGAYKLALDDSDNIVNSLDKVTWLALISIALITIAFFRKTVPTLIVLTGVVLGTLYTMGFTFLTVGKLNMVTSILAGILMGFGVDYGIHFMFRTRLELGAGKPYDVAIRDAILNAGRPALVSAVVTAGSFFVLLVSRFAGFSQFGFLSGFGTFIIGFTLFCWSPAILSILGKRWPNLPAKLIGTMKPPPAVGQTGQEIRIPRPMVMLLVCSGVVAAISAFAVPWQDFPTPKDKSPSLWERLKGGVRFDYNTRALMPANRPSVSLLEEINERFRISSDPIAVYTKDLAETKDLWDALNPLDPKKYSTVSQVVSVFSFVPPKETAEANAKILAEWKEELKDIEVSSLPPELQEKAEMFQQMLEARPFGVEEVPEIYAQQFRNLPSAQPENKGYLTFIYPGVDLWESKKMLEFANQTYEITGASGQKYYSAGTTILYSRLARIVLADGRLTLVLTALWILLMHYADFRSVKLALASVIPLGVGLVMTLGLMSVINARLNFMNIVILPILLGFGVSHGLYLLHRFLEGVSPLVALRSIGAAVASSTLTTIAGFASLFAASHNGLRSMGLLACIGLASTLVVSFTVLAAVLQLIHDQRVKKRAARVQPQETDALSEQRAVP